jgi:hypothetical protein
LKITLTWREDTEDEAEEAEDRLEAGHRGQATRAGQKITMSPNQVLYELFKIVLFHDVKKTAKCSC